MERGCWVGKGTDQEIKNVTIRVQEREPMFSRRRQTSNEQSREREKERGNKHQTGRQTKILKFYVQRLRSPFLTTTKPLLFGALPFSWFRVACTDNTWYQDFTTPLTAMYFLCRPLGSWGATSNTVRAVCNLCLSQRGFLPAQIRALTGPRPLLLSGHKHIWSTEGSGLAERKLASGSHIMLLSHSDEQDPERCFFLCYLPPSYQFYFNIQLTTTQMFTNL